MINKLYLLITVKKNYKLPLVASLKITLDE